MVDASREGQREIWEAARASLDFIRDIVLITRGDDDLIDALIFTAALDANMTRVNRDAGLQVTYGGAEVSAPNDLRRPVSINAVAQSLRLPFETVRRRFLGLSRAGLCVVTAQGVVVPREAVTSRAYVAKQRGRYERIRDFYRALRAAGVLSVAEAAQAPPPAEPLVRAANRALSEYTLRACHDLLGLTGEAMSSLVLLELVLANIRPLATAELAGWSRAPERLGRPVRIAALAGPLRVSGETVRRHLKGLEALGFCSRTAGGMVATAPAQARPQLARLAEINQANVQRFFARLSQLGVLADWEVAGASETIALPSHPGRRNTARAGEVTGARDRN